MICSLPYDVLRCEEELCFRLQKMQQTADEEGRSHGELKDFDCKYFATKNGISPLFLIW